MRKRKALLDVDPIEIDAGADLLALARQYREDGVVPGDPDRNTAVVSNLPFDASFVADRSFALETAAIEEHMARGELATCDLRHDATLWSTRAANRQRQLETTIGEAESVAKLLGVYNERVRGFERREPARAERFRYRLFQFAFALGDIAGITNGAMQLGDAWPLALTQGIGIGVAGVAAGMVGAEIRRQRERANRPATPPKGAEPFEHLFGEDVGRSHANVVLGIAGVAVGLIALGQFALRASLDGNVVGLVYAAFGAVMVGGSFVNSYMHDCLDELANYREGLEARAVEVTDLIDELGEPQGQAAALAEKADRMKNAFVARGKAVAALIRAEQLSIAVANPTTFGTHHDVEDRSDASGSKPDTDEALDDFDVRDFDLGDAVSEPARSNGNAK